MGLAVFVQDIRFSGNGKVTLTGNTKPSAIRIVAENSYNASSVQLGIGYSPVNAALRGITWSISSGGQYASIDENGKLTINQGASNASVTVRAVSQADGSVSDEKTIAVTYQNPVTLLTKVTVHDNPTINTGISLFDENDTIEIKYKVTDYYSKSAKLWHSPDEKSCVYISNRQYVITVFGADRSHAQNIATGEQHTYLAPLSLNVEYIDEYSIGGLTRNGEPIAQYGQQKVKSGFTPSGNVYILHSQYDYAFAGIEIYYFKFKRNGVVTHAFMPAVKDGIYGFYDASTDTFITNTGESGTITE